MYFRMCTGKSRTLSIDYPPSSFLLPLMNDRPGHFLISFQKRLIKSFLESSRWKTTNSFIKAEWILNKGRNVVWYKTRVNPSSSQHPPIFFFVVIFALFQVRNYHLFIPFRFSEPSREESGARALVNPFIYLFMCHGSSEPDGHREAVGLRLGMHRAGESHGSVETEWDDRKSHGETDGYSVLVDAVGSKFSGGNVAWNENAVRATYLEKERVLTPSFSISHLISRALIPVNIQDSNRIILFARLERKI